MIDNKKHLNKVMMEKVRKLCTLNNTCLEDTWTMSDSEIDQHDLDTKYVNGDRCLSFDKIISICNEFEYKFDDLLSL